MANKNSTGEGRPRAAWQLRGCPAVPVDGPAGTGALLPAFDKSALAMPQQLGQPLDDGTGQKPRRDLASGARNEGGSAERRLDRETDRVEDRTESGPLKTRLDQQASRHLSCRRAEERDSADARPRNEQHLQLRARAQLVPQLEASKRRKVGGEKG